MEESCRRYGYPRPRILVEPGRSVISPAGTTIYTIGAIKDIPGIRKYVAVDGGMNDNPRPALYQAKYEGLLANKASLPPQEVVAVTGRCCESGRHADLGPARSRRSPPVTCWPSPVPGPIPIPCPATITACPGRRWCWSGTVRPT